MKTDTENLLASLVGENFTTDQGGSVEGTVGFYAIIDLSGDSDLGFVANHAHEMQIDLDLNQLEGLRGWWTYREDNQGFCYVDNVSETDAKAWFLLQSAEDGD